MKTPTNMSSNSLDTPTQDTDDKPKRGLPAIIQKYKSGIAFLKANKKRFFWAWIIYQTIKGTLTTTIIWIPLLYAWYSD